MPESRVYANAVRVSVGERDAVITAEFVHPRLVGESAPPAPGEPVIELVVPVHALAELRQQLDDLGA